MKKTILIILAALAAAFAFVSCEKEEDEISIKYFVVGWTEEVHPHNINLYEYDKNGNKLLKRTLQSINHHEIYEYNSAPGMQNIVIYFTDTESENFYKSIQNNIFDRQSVVIGGSQIKITREEFINYTLNN